MRDEAQLEDPHLQDTLLNPHLIIEGLSPSTEAWDRGGKFAAYRQIPSLEVFLLVSQDHARIERHIRDQGSTLVPSVRW